MSEAGRTPEWWRGGVIYQVYPRSFQDTTGDGSGDLKGVKERMGHIASLGADAVWLSPFFKSPMADMGYDVADYRAVDPMFGTMQDFEDLVAEAHRQGLKVIIDQVLSHTSDRHAWFVESRADRTNPKADWYVWADARPDGTAPNNWLSVFGGSAWEWDSVRRQYYLHNFLAAQPDLNFHNREVQDALLDAVRFWLDKGVDGIRLDTVNYYFHDRWLRSNPPVTEAAAGTITETNPYLYQSHLFDKTQAENLDFLKRLRSLLNEYEGRASIGEVGDESRSLQTVAAYTDGSDRLNMCYTFDMLGAEFSPAHIRKCVQSAETEVAGGWICWAFSNHDVVRHVSRWTRLGEDTDNVAKFAITLLGSLRGSICLYQGEEIGLTEAEIAFEDLRDPYGIRFWPGFKGRDGARTPMVWDAEKPNSGFTSGKPWLPIPAQHRWRSADVQWGEKHSVLSRYRAVLALRKRHAALGHGSIAFIDGGDDLLAFFREANAEKLLCVFNFSQEERRWTLPSGTLVFEEFEIPDGKAKLDGLAITLQPLGCFVGRVL